MTLLMFSFSLGNPSGTSIIKEKTGKYYLRSRENVRVRLYVCHPNGTPKMCTEINISFLGAEHIVYFPSSPSHVINAAVKRSGYLREQGVIYGNGFMVSPFRCTLSGLKHT